LTIDVTANDEDGNCQPVMIDGFDATTARGGTVVRSIGTGPGHRDELVYTPPATVFIGEDTFEYLAGDGTGLTSAGTVTIDVRPMTMNGYWTFDEGAGAVAADETVNGRDGTLVGPTWTTGTFGGALDFDGVNDHIDVPALDLDENRVTFSAWIRRDGTQTNWAGLVVSRQGSTLAGLHFGLNEELRYTWNNEPSTWGWDSGLVPPDGQWVFVALVVEPDRATIYLYDGTLTSAVNNVPHAPEAFDGITRIGWNSSSGGRRFDGTLDDVRVYGHALSALEVDALARIGGPAELPHPADGSLLPFQDSALTWLGGHAATSHDLYFGTDRAVLLGATTSSPEFLGNQAGTSRVIGGYLPNVPYYWRVDERSGAEVVTGQVWQFEIAEANHWQLDEGAGTTALDVEGTAHGTYVGALLLGQPGATPALGSSVDLDGVDDRVTIPALNLATDRATFTTWLRRDGAQAPWAGLIFSRAGNTIAGLNFGEADELRYHWNGGAWGFNSGLIVPDAQWVFAALVVEPSRATLYMHDGVGWQSATNTAGHSAEEFDGDLQLGWDQGFGSRRFDGRLDDVRVIRAALTQAELEALRTASL
jgi:hypothetical protein